MFLSAKKKSKRYADFLDSIVQQNEEKIRAKAKSVAINKQDTTGMFSFYTITNMIR